MLKAGMVRHIPAFFYPYLFYRIYGLPNLSETKVSKSNEIRICGRWNTYLVSMIYASGDYEVRILICQNTYLIFELL